LRKEPRYASKHDIEDYLLALQNDGKSAASVNLAGNAIKTFFSFVHKRKWRVSFPRMKEPKRLPKLLSREELRAMIGNTENAKHKLLIVMLYSTGLRLSEIRNLNHNDLFPDEGFGIVREGKGRKERRFHLSSEVVRILPGGDGFVFGGRSGPYSVKSIQMIIRQAARRAGIRRHVTPHMLRHSYATHLLEQGVDIRIIQELLGHASLNTTQIYTHVAADTLKGLPNPYDTLQKE